MGRGAPKRVGLEWRRLEGQGRREGDGVAVLAGADRLQLGSSEEVGGELDYWGRDGFWDLILILKSNLG